SSQWFFDAGPCRVEVTGTQFDMHWSAAGQILEVMLYSGSVTVKGPPATAGVPMRAGQRLVMNVRQGTVRLGELEAAPGTGAAASPREAAPPVDEKVTTTERRAETEAKSGEPHHRETWAARVASGDFRGVVAQAKRRGIDRVLREDSAENIMALADAARFANSLSLAQRALLSVRARFPQTAPAHRAAFLLGRVAEDQHGNLSGALQWYDTYLSDAPDDSFRAEAMGRKMAATLQVSGPDRARPLATQYLKRYPQGAYAHAARAILAQ
ncbi:MAG: tetratricopeptide repeat protein, partial [Deltaproteobacteria bacterium]|nr:tetratricopeptide repeat protein [Deltaproteobacteria bacterium]